MPQGMIVLVLHTRRKQPVKRCKYCGKPLTGPQEKYCNADCRMKAHAFNRFMDRKTHSFLFLFIVGTAGIIAGSVMMMMKPGVGTGIIGLSLIVWGLNFFILPFGFPDSFYWLGILRSIRIIRAVSLLIILCGIVIAILGFGG